MVSEVKDKFTNSETKQANIQMAIISFSEIIVELRSETSKQREIEESQLKYTDLNNKPLDMTEE